MMSVGGARNRVVQHHADMCHHCGFHAVPVKFRCATCGIQWHGPCGPATCEACDMGGEGGLPNCHLCEMEDPAYQCETATDRLAKRIVYHGYQWRAAASPISSHVELHPDSPVARALQRDPGRRFDMDELPGRGTNPMRVAVNGVGVLESVPLVVHSWCVACLFQISPAVERNWKERLLRSMSSCPTLEYGTREASVTKGGVRCQFCGDDRGWLTFCVYHSTHAAGCDRCRDSSDRTRTFHAFHPSCAVRWGMQRIVRDGVHGMVCARQTHWCAKDMQGLKHWLGHASGINTDIVHASCVLPSNLSAPPDTPFKGNEYGQSMIPLKHR